MDINQALIKYWGHTKFRPMQEDIINSIMEGHDTLALMPTGGGKSLCYQLPALVMEGVCIVVSPLIALMKDQVQQLQKKDIRATAIYSGMSFREMDKAFDMAVDGKVKFLYVSPERLQTELFQVRLSNMKVSILAVDEAHCISQWGYDFRPSYLKIAEIRHLIPDTPVMALTATARPEVRNDIVERMHFRRGKIFIRSFERKNLSYSVLKEENKLNRLLDMIKRVPGSIVVFANSRRRTMEVADFLRRNNISATFYNAGLDMLTRNERQNQWIQNGIRVMVSTNAFGMGIDKPDVRMVVHYEPPSELESYYQEAGRAGRDEKKAFAVCLYDDNDIEQMQGRVKSLFPEFKEIKKVYQALANYYEVTIGSGQGVSFDFDITHFSKTYELKPIVTYNALKTLEQHGFIALSDAVMIPSRLIIKLNRENLYRFEVKHPEDEPLLKALLRMYGGIYDYYTPIREAELARQINTDADNVITRLKKLHDYDVIDYLPAKDKPQLTYTLPRIDTNYLELDEKFLERRKASMEERINAMRQYLETKWKCRSQILLQYFGEEDAPRCGICDVCLRRHELDQSDIEFEKNMGVIRAAIMEKPSTTAELINKLPQFKAETVITSVRWLMDTGLITEDADRKLHWKP